MMQPGSPKSVESSFFSDVFHFHADAQDCLDVADLNKVLRCCGFAATPDEFERATSRVVASKKRITYADFLQVTQSEEMQHNAKQEVLDALHGFCYLRGNNSGYASHDELRSALTKFGAAVLNEIEFQSLMDAVNANQVKVSPHGQINIEDFVEKVLLMV
mmetsp:Transcript_11936/g.22111  ORF Transcript_11936/g.22111 Transcript_11936/m.22111 type:complete len:160 (+) Transcript_11936:73-552(+)